MDGQNTGLMHWAKYSNRRWWLQVALDPNANPNTQNLVIRADYGSGHESMDRVLCKNLYINPNLAQLNF